MGCPRRRRKKKFHHAADRAPGRTVLSGGVLLRARMPCSLRPTKRGARSAKKIGLKRFARIRASANRKRRGKFRHCRRHGRRKSRPAWQKKWTPKRSRPRSRKGIASTNGVLGESLSFARQERAARRCWRL